MRGFSLRDLSEKLEKAVSHVALAKYEDGSMKPSGDVLSRLCMALDVSPDALFRPTSVSIGPVSFRKRKDFGEKQSAILVETVRARLEDYLEAEEIVGDMIGFKLPKIPTDVDAREAALVLRDLWNLGDQPISNLTELLEKQGIRVIEVDESSDRFDGCQLEGHPVIVISGRADQPVTRKRFTLAHELAHLVLSEWARIGQLTEKAIEKAMNTFASEFLFPAKALIAFFGAKRTSVTLEELKLAKLRYGVSISAIVYSMHELGVITQAAYRRFHTMVRPRWVASKSMAAWEPDDEKTNELFLEKPERFDRIVMRGMAEGVLSLSRAAGLLKRSLSDLRREAEPVV